MFIFPYTIKEYQCVHINLINKEIKGKDVSPVEEAQIMYVITLLPSMLNKLPHFSNVSSA